LKAALPAELLIRTSLKDFTLADSSTSIARDLLDAGFEAIGFSCYMWNVRKINEIARLLRNENPSLLLFAGGPHVTAAPEDLQEEGLFNYLVQNEGEDILEKILYGTLPEDNQIVAGGQVNLETLPSPFLAGTVDPAGYEGILWELSRGCPYNCAFCYESRNRGWVRRFPMSRLKEELRMFVRKKVRDIWILDSTFNHDDEWCIAFLEMLTELAPHIHFTFEIRAERITPAQAKLFGDLVVSLQIGLQSVQPKVMSRMNRPFRPGQFRKKIALLNQYYLVYGFDLIYGLPLDTLDGFRESIDFALSLSPSNVDIFPLSLLPGTELSEKAREWGINHDGSFEKNIMGREGFTDEDLEEADRLTKLCDFFYTKGLASMWFKTACEALELSPSLLLERFGIWLEQQDLYIEDIMEKDPAPFQKSFLQFSFSWRNRTEQYLPLESFILWHEALNRIMDGESDITVELKYDPDALTQIDIIGLDAFGEFFPPVDQSWRIFTEDNNIYWELVI